MVTINKLANGKIEIEIDLKMYDEKELDDLLIKLIFQKCLFQRTRRINLARENEPLLFTIVNHMENQEKKCETCKNKGNAITLCYGCCVTGQPETNYINYEEEK